jgi:hypothetical protein
MYLFLIIFIFVVVMQFLMGVFAYRFRSNLKNKYSYYLGEQVEFNKILESFQAKTPQLKVVVADELNDVCIAEDNLIIISKKSIYSKDLYSNLFLLFQLELTNVKYSQLRTIYTLQSLIFFSQILCIFLFFALEGITGVVLLAGFVIFVLNLIIMFWGINQYISILKVVKKEAKDILKMDSVEEARADALINELRYEILTYPLEIPWRLKNFMGK